VFTTRSLISLGQYIALQSEERIELLFAKHGIEVSYSWGRHGRLDVTAATIREWLESLPVCSSTKLGSDLTLLIWRRLAFGKDLMRQSLYEASV